MIIINNDRFLGNLFICLIDKDILDIEIDIIFEYQYKISTKLNEKENTIITLIRDLIDLFVSKNKDVITSDENKIFIINKKAARKRFIQRYFDFELNKEMIKLIFGKKEAKQC